MICIRCGWEMEMTEIGYICDPPDDSCKMYFYRCPMCKHESSREVSI